MHRLSLTLLLASVLLLSPGCQMNERMSGAAIGAAGGATIGGLTTGNAVGVLLGGLAGGVAGYIVGDYMADKRERCGPPAADPCAPPPDPCAPPPCPPQQQYYAPQQQYYAPQQQVYVPRGPTVGGVKQRVPATSGAADRWVEKGRRSVTSAQARAAYREALRLDPHHAEAWYRVGLLQQAAGSDAEARSAFRQAVESDPRHDLARRQLALAGG